MNQSQRRIVLFLLLPLILFIGGLLALPWMLNRPAIVEALNREFEQRTGLHLSAEAWQVGLLPSIALTMERMQAHDPAVQTPLLVADRVEIALQWLPLLEGRAVAKDVFIERPRLTVQRSADGRWALAGGSAAASSDDGGEPLSFLQAVRNLLVVDGSITIIDDSGPAPHVPLRVVVTEGTLSTEMMGRQAKLHLSGSLPQGQKEAVFLWDGSLTQGSKGQGIQAEGDLRLHYVDVRHVLSSWAGLDALSDGLNGPAELTAHLRWSAKQEGNDVIADEWRIRLGDITMQGSGAVHGLGTKRPTFAGTFSTPPVAIARVLNQIPSAWVSEEFRMKFAEHDVDGLITIQSLSLSGDLASGSHPLFNGQLHIREGRMKVAPEYPPLEALSASLSFDAMLLRIKELRAQCGPVRLTAKELLVKEWTTDPRIDARISAAASVAAVLDTARGIDEFSQLRSLLAQMEQVTGDVELVAHVTGQPAGGKPVSFVAADLLLHHGGLRSAALPEPLRQVEARIHASPERAVIERLTGWLGPAQFHAFGAIDWKGGQAYSNVKVDMVADASDMRALFTEDSDTGLRPEMEGTIRLQAALTGPMGASRFKGYMDLQQAALRIPNRLSKPLQAPATVEFDARLDDGRRLDVSRLSLRFPPIKIVGDGILDFSEDMAFSANVSSGTLSIKKLPPGVALGPIRAGTLGAALHMEGRLKDRASWRMSGEARFDRGTIVVDGLESPIREAFVTLRFDQDRVHIPRMAFHVGASDLRISGSVSQWMEQPKVRLVVESSQIDVAAFSPSSRAEPRPAQPRPRSSAWWSDMTLNAYVFADYVYYKKFLLTDLSTRIAWDHGQLTVERISGDTNEGHIAGQVKLRSNGRRIDQARSAFRASGIPIDRVLSLVQEKPVLSGWLTASGKLQGDFDRAGLMTGTLASRQPIQVLIEHGRIYRLPVLSTLLSVMNLPAVLQGQVDLDRDGLPLDRLKLAFSINNGLMNVKEILLDSPVLKISGTGRYDIAADEFDMVLATSPLGSYSAMLKRIPLFGQLLAGDRKGFDTAVFELKGPANHPKLRYLPAESLMTGVKGTAQLAFDILVNAITLPQKAYSVIEEGTGGSEDEDL